MREDEASILVAEDDSKIRMIIKDYLEKEGYKVKEAENGEQAIEIFRQEPIKLVLLDVMMPRGDGWEVCKSIRKTSDVPIIFLTARVDECDELRGFKLGADDYIKKPFSPAVMVARVKKYLSTAQDECLQRGIVKLYKETMKLVVDEMPIELTTKEFQIMQYLVENQAVVFSREQILDHVWGYDFIGDIRIVDTHIKKIRKALGEYSYLIRTVFGAGYKFEAEV